MTDATPPNDATRITPQQMPAEPASAPPARRSWWQFGLRTLLVLISLIAVVTGYTVSWVKRSEAQKAFIARIEKARGWVFYDRPANFDDTTLGPIDRWIVEKLGPDYLWSIKEVTMGRPRDSKLPPENLTSFAEFPSLEELYLTHTQVQDWTPLSKLPRLRSLQLSLLNDSVQANLSPCRQLQKLSLDAAQVRDITFLIGLDNLEELDLQYSDVQQLVGLAQLPKLRKLNCTRLQIQDFTPLAKCKQLEELSLWQTEFKELELLAELPKLRKLNLESTWVNDLEPLRRMHLTELSLYSTDADDYSPLTACRELRSLNLGDSKFKQYELLAAMPQLEELFLYNMPLDDLRPLAKNTNLRKLFLWNTKVVDVTPLAKLSKLEKLEIHNTNVTDLEPLVGLPLKRLLINPATFTRYGNRLQQMFPNCVIGTDVFTPQ